MVEGRSKYRMLLLCCFLLLIHPEAVLPKEWYLEDQRDHLLEQNKLLSEQVMMHQMFLEERMRTSGSGLKKIRQEHEGTESYMSESYTGKSSFVLHNHPDHIDTVGVGELEVSLNGVDFKTSHNDYKTNMPSKISKKFNAVQNIPNPDVPPAVLKKGTVDGQIKEMREWFKAWKDQDFSVRDYRKYFKPILCYLEGAWMKETDNVTKLYESMRHNFDAWDWQELHQKSRFASYSGWKDKEENMPYLPTTILETVDDKLPVAAQWNYRILCHPLKEDLPTIKFNLVDDIKTRMGMGGIHLESYFKSTAARFQLVADEADDVGVDREYKDGLLDELMAQIPGMNNYGAYLEDHLFKGKDTSFDHMAYDSTKEDLQPQNAAYYHRWFKTNYYDYMGKRVNHYGFNDPNLFMAMTTQDEVAGMKAAKRCYSYSETRYCKYNDEQKWTYAIPLEIVYLTPLSKWNPYDITIHEDLGQPEEERTVRLNDRNGSLTHELAFNGSGTRDFYITPSSFFTGNEEVNQVPADTVRKLKTGVLDKKGELRSCAASGIRLFLPEIPGVGVLRQRYPIAPVMYENVPHFKEISALRDLIMNSASYSDMFSGMTSLRNTTTVLTLKSPWKNSDIKHHTHNVHLTDDEVNKVKKGDKVHAYTSFDSSHSHALTIVYDKSNEQFEYVICDDQVYNALCIDKHPKELKLIQKTIPFKVWINVTSSYGTNFQAEI